MRGVSALFIERPVATILITLAVVLAGILGYVLLPVAPLPNMDIPTIRVSAAMPGASAETMASTVATPLERSLGRIAGVTEMTSSSSLGTTSVVLQFDMSRDINGAARDVQAAINAARGQLPSSLRSNPSYRKFNPADAPILILSMTSDVLSRGQMYDIATTVLAQRIMQIEGVGDVNVGGASSPAVRVDLNPQALANQGVSLTALGQSIAAANQLTPLGFVNSEDKEWQVKVNAQLSQAKELMPLVINYRNGSAVRLSDVATVTDSVLDTRNAGMFGNKKEGMRPAIILMITKSPEANIIETVDRIKAEIPELQNLLPGAVALQVTMDRSVTIRASLFEVERALVIAIMLVIMVVFMFLGRARTTIIPAVAVPVSLVGTFAVMYLCGFSLNNLSLMALTIATGFVVDDAIVVLENIMRHIEEGMSPKDAAFKGAKEVGFTVLSMSLSLIAVFTPFLFIGDMLGRLFKEFAVTLSVAILISLIVSLVTTPMLCSQLLKAEATQSRPPLRIVRWFRDFLGGVQTMYGKALKVALSHKRLTILSWFVTLFLTGYFFVLLPKSFFPEQDSGSLRAMIRADQSVSFQAMSLKLDQFMAILLNDPAVEMVMGSIGASGYGNSNSARTFVALKPLKSRGESMQSVIARLRKKAAVVSGAQLFLSPVQDLPSGGRSANADNQFTLESDDLVTLRKWEPVVREAMKAVPGFVDVDSDQENKGLETALVYNRDVMSRYGVTSVDLNRTLYGAFGQSTVSTIYGDKNQYKVVMEIAPEFAQNPEALDKLMIINSRGDAIPLSVFATWQPSNSPLSVSHQGQFAASTISFNLAEGYSFSYAQDQMEQLVVRVGLPNSIQAGFAGSAKTFQQSQGQQLTVLIMALVSVYLVLGMLYESYIHPVTILSTIPSAGMGALMALWLFNKEFTVIAMIAMLLLIGIVKKNAIMMVDFAIDARRQKSLSAEQAIFDACMLRFRPILMTTLAALLGAVPLAVASGDGAELRQPLGIAIVGGLVVSQLLTLFTTPVMYLYLDRFGEWVKRLLRRPSSLAPTEVL